MAGGKTNMFLKCVFILFILALVVYLSIFFIDWAFEVWFETDRRGNPPTLFEYAKKHFYCAKNFFKNMRLK